MDGNVLVTGNVFKPSDMRLKDNFASVSPAVQLNVINNIKMYPCKVVGLCMCVYIFSFTRIRYDYDIQVGGNKKRERGGEFMRTCKQPHEVLLGECSSPNVLL